MKESSFFAAPELPATRAELVELFSRTLDEGLAQGHFGSDDFEQMLLRADPLEFSPNRDSVQWQYAQTWRRLGKMARRLGMSEAEVRSEALARIGNALEQFHGRETVAGENRGVASHPPSPVLRSFWLQDQMRDEIVAVSPGGDRILGSDHIFSESGKNVRAVSKNYLGFQDPERGGFFMAGPEQSPIYFHENEPIIWFEGVDSRRKNFSPLDLAVSPNGKFLVMAGEREILKWSLDGRNYQVFDMRQGYLFSAVAVSSDSRWVAGGTDHPWDGNRPLGWRDRIARRVKGGYRVGLWESGNGRFERWMDGIVPAARALGFSSDGRHLSLVDKAGNVWRWNPETGEGGLLYPELVGKPRDAKPNGPSVRFLPGGDTLLSISDFEGVAHQPNDYASLQNTKVRLFDLSRGFDGSYTPGKNIHSFAISSDGKTLLLGLGHGHMAILDMKTLWESVQ